MDRYFTAAPVQRGQYAAVSNVVRKASALAKHHIINAKTAVKWCKRTTTADAPMGPEPVSTILTAEQEAMAVAFRQHTLLPLDDCLYALQETSPTLLARPYTAVFSAMA